MIRRTTLTYTDGTEDVINHGGKLTGLFYPTELQDFKVYRGKMITHIKSEAKPYYRDDKHPFKIDYDEDVNPFKVSEHSPTEIVALLKNAKTISREKFLPLHQFNYKKYV